MLKCAGGSSGGGESADVSVTGVTLDKTSISIVVGYIQQLTATIEPEDATNQNVTWSSSDEAKATVSSTGLVTGVAVGTVVITVTTEDGGHTATCALTITPVISVTGVSLNKSATTVDAGSTEQLTAIIEPPDATNKKVTWTTSDAGKATVSSKGLVKAEADGAATITVTTLDGGYTASCTVTIPIPVPATNSLLSQTV